MAVNGSWERRHVVDVDILVGNNIRDRGVRMAQAGFL